LAQILAAVKDTGGANGVIKVVNYLSKKGCPVDFVVNGAALKIKEVQQYPHLKESDPTRVLEHFGLPRVFITSMCSFGGVGRDLVPLLRTYNIPTVALQDAAGARLKEADSWGDAQFRPDHIIVNDAVGTRLVLEAWPEFPRHAIHELGFPVLDDLAGFDATGAAAQQVKKYELDARPVVYFSGQLQGTPETLDEIVDVLYERAAPIQFILGKHRRVHDEEVNKKYPGLGERIEAAYARATMLKGQGARVLDNTTWPETPLIAACDLVLGMYPTAFQDAVMLRKLAIAIMYPQLGRAGIVADTGGLLTRHPLCELGAVVEVHDKEELRSALAAAFDGDLGERLRPMQEQALKADGKNAERIGEFVLSLAR
jgi:hypothetical protein